MLAALLLVGMITRMGPAEPAPAAAEKPGTARASPERELPPGQRIALTDGQLFVPEGFRPDGGGFALTLHLHGAAWAAEQNFARAGQNGVLVTVVLPGLSAVYTSKFRDPDVLPRIAGETRARLASLFGGQEPVVRRLIVTSFSAGFGGVRELLKDPAAFDRIDALVMADSIHAGFMGDPQARQVNPEQLEGFLRFAREAAAGRQWLIISHSAIRPAEYASTTETADYLLSALGGARERVHETWPGDLLLQSRFRAGHLEILGFAGDTGPDHMKHLHHLSALLERMR